MAPSSNDERMSTLASLRVMDATAGASLDRLTELVAYTFKAPVAFVSLIGVEKQRLISRQGLALCETDIQDSICAVTIGGREVMVLPDLRLDLRFQANPLVIHPPFLRFYAGAPLFAQNGVAIGALCVMDEAVRDFSESDRRQLETLAQSIMHQLELRVLSGRREPVSGFPNRHQFIADFDGLVSRDVGKAGFAVLVDVLDLPRANEAGQVLGMAPLEELIRKAGIRLSVALEGVASIYHVGVTRFAFLLDLPSMAQVEALIEDLRLRMKAPLVAASVPMSPMFHAGACAFAQSSDRAGDVIRKTLIGLHSAIAENRTLSWYTETRDDQLRRSYRLAADAVRGLERKEFHLVYQPRFASSNLALVAAEVLIRWTHPHLGAVSPAEFIPVFERTALIGDVSDWVIAQALHQLAQWRRNGLMLTLSINLSVKDIAKPDAASRLLEAIYKHGLKPDDIEVEITEGEWLRVNSMPGEQIGIMAHAGIKIAIDDFGSGYSNFGYLSELPIHTLKLDKSLIDGIVTDAKAAIKVKAIVRLSNELGYITVAEGVETSEQLSLLQAMNCDEIQGYALARPMSAKELVALINAQAPAP